MTSLAPSQQVSKLSAAGMESKKVPALPKPLLQPAGSDLHIGGYQSHRRFEAQSTPSGAFSSGSQLRLDIERNSLMRAEHCALRFRISESGGSNSVTVVPAMYFIERLEWYSRNGSGPELQRYFPETMQFELSALASEGQQNAFARGVADLGDRGYTLAASESKDFFIPLPHSFIDGVRPFIQAYDQDIELRVYCRNGIIASGSGTIQLDQCSLHVVEHYLDAEDTAYHNETHRSHIVRGRIVNPIHVTRTATVTGGSQVLIDLQNVDQDTFAFLFVARSGSSPAATNFGVNSFVYPGARAQFDIQDSSGQSIWTNGNPVTFAQLKSFVEPLHVSGKVPNNMMLVPLCEDVRAAFKGVKNGSMPFRSNKDNIAWTPAAAGTAHVSRLTLDAAPTAGYYQLTVVADNGGGSWTTEPLAYNASAAVIAAAVNNLKGLRDRGFSVSASAAVSAGTTTDFTWSPRGDPKMQVYIDIGDCATSATAASSVQTQGVDGFGASGSYTIDVYALTHRDHFFDAQSGQHRVTNSYTN